MSNAPTQVLVWEIRCERDGEPYASAIVEAATEREALHVFFRQSALAGYAEPVEVVCLG